MRSAVNSSAGSSPRWWQAPGRTDLPGTALPRVADAESRYERWALGALLAFLLLNLDAPPQFIPAREVLRPALLCALIALGAHLLEGSKGAQTDRRSSAPLEVQFVLWISAWAVVTIPLSTWPGGSFADALLFLRMV